MAPCLFPAGSFTLKRKCCFMDKGGGEEGCGPDHTKTASDGPANVYIYTYWDIFGNHDSYIHPTCSLFGMVLVLN